MYKNKSNISEIISYFESGSFDEIDKRTEVLESRDRGFIYFISIYFIYINKIQESRNLLTRLLNSQDPIKFQALLTLSIINYIDSKIEECNNNLSGINNFTLNLKEDKSIAYANLIYQLLNWRMKNSSFKMYASNTFSKIYCIGDSHSLSGNGVIFKIKDESFLGEAKLVMGVQMHHIANELNNKYKSSINKIIQTIPKESTVLFSIGEIDTRFEYGFIKHSSANEKLLINTIELVIRKYLEFLNQFKGVVKIIVSGIPDSTKKAKNKDEDLNKIRDYVIANVNLQLKKTCSNLNLGFLDLYEFTQNAKEECNNYHLDSFHLSPLAYSIAFEKNLILNNN